MNRIKQLLLTASYATRGGAAQSNDNGNALSIRISGNVTSGVSTLVTVNNGAIPIDFINNNSSAFRVRLYNSVANYPVCTLLDATPQNVSNFNVTLPVDVGPSGAYYALALDYTEAPTLDFLVANEGPSQPQLYNIIADQFSNLFFLSNATSGWTTYETNISQQADLPQGGLFIYETNASLPCTSYDCVRKCAELYRTPTRDTQQPVTVTYDAAYLKCAGQCAGVRLPPNPKATGDPNAPPNDLLTPPLLNNTCDATQFNTPCRGECCNSGQLCLPWGTCVNLDNDAAAESSVIPSITPSATGLIPSGSASPTGASTKTSSAPSLHSSSASNPGILRGGIDQGLQPILGMGAIVAGVIVFCL